MHRFAVHNFQCHGIELSAVASQSPKWKQDDIIDDRRPTIVLQRLLWGALALIVYSTVTSSIYVYTMMEILMYSDQWEWAQIIPSTLFAIFVTNNSIVLSSKKSKYIMIFLGLVVQALVSHLESFIRYHYGGLLRFQWLNSYREIARCTILQQQVCVSDPLRWLFLMNPAHHLNMAILGRTVWP